MSENLKIRFDHLKAQLLDPNFQTNKGLSNEVGYYIFDYPANCTSEMNEMLNKLKSLPLASKVNLKVFDVYDIMMELLKDQQKYTGTNPIPILEKIEKRQGLAALITQINNILEMSENDNLIVKYIQERLSEKCIIFLVGIGKVYPILRAHKILTTMHQIIDDNPVVMFYPGNYDEISLRAFGEVKDDNYYRAFRIE